MTFITIATLRMYADRKKWPLKEIRVALTNSKNYANDCVNRIRQKCVSPGRTH